VNFALKNSGWEVLTVGSATLRSGRIMADIPKAKYSDSESRNFGVKSTSSVPIDGNTGEEISAP
jgi:hypothetical protein